MSRRVLLLHGWGGSGKTTFVDHGWNATLSAIGRESLAIDLPGHGLAPASTDGADYADLTGLVEAMLPDEQLDVVAYSLGAKIALEMAVRRPDRFDRIVLVGLGDNAFTSEKAGAAVASVLEGGDFEAAPQGVQALINYSRASGSDPLALAAVLRRSPNPMLTPDRLQKLCPKVMVINGDQDALAMPDGSLVAVLGDPIRVLLSGADHFTLLSDPGLQTAAASFLSYAGTDYPKLRKQFANGEYLQ